MAWLCICEYKIQILLRKYQTLNYRYNYYFNIKPVSPGAPSEPCSPEIPLSPGSPTIPLQSHLNGLVHPLQA